jgi:GrpB-like predicted nucleotidyltransferase (UPF0157 family)
VAVTLGLIRGLVALADHDDTWREAFLAERDRIGAALEGFGCEIEHVGSTAVPGIPAKPILDIALGCPPKTDPLSLKARLEDLGYIYRGDAGDSGGHVFVRGTEAVRTHHLHVVALQGEQWAAYLALRDLLRSDAKSRELYAAAKRTLARRFKDDRKSYTDGKAGTVQQLLLKARSP